MLNVAGVREIELGKKKFPSGGRNDKRCRPLRARLKLTLEPHPERAARERRMKPLKFFILPAAIADPATSNHSLKPHGGGSQTRFRGSPLPAPCGLTFVR